MGEIIKELRTQAGMTQEELGKALGLKKSAIAKYEAGRVENIKRSTIQKMATLFDVDATYILGLKAEKRTPIPSDLEEIGVEWMLVAKEAKKTGLTPEQVTDLLQAIKKVTDVEKK